MARVKARSIPQFPIATDTLALLNGILDSSVAAILVVDLQGGIVLANQRVQRILGVSPGEITHCSHPERDWKIRDWNITDGEGHPLCQAQLPFVQVIETGNPVLDVQQSIVRADGSRCYLSINGSPLRDQTGKLTHVLLLLSDVTDRYLTEQKLRETEAVLQETQARYLEACKQTEETLQLHRQQEQLIEQTTQQIRQSLNLKSILQTTVTEVQQFLNADRVVICRLNPTDNSGLVLAETCLQNCPTMLGWRIGNTLPAVLGYTQIYQPGQVQAIADISHSDLDPALVKLLATFQVKAQLTLPIFQNNRMWGLLIAHQCQRVRQWQSWEIEVLQRLESRLALAIQQAEFYHQVQDLNAALEQKVTERTLELQQSLAFEAALKRITDKVRDSLDEDQILQVAIEELGKGLDVESCSTGIYSDDQRSLTVCHEYARAFPSALGNRLKIADDPSIHQQLLQQKQPSQFCALAADSSYLSRNGSAVLVCPIFDNRGVLGAIWLCRHRLKHFDELEVRLVQQVANQCAIALRQSRLYQAAQAQVQELEKLNRLKTDFLSTVSHELRTPLSSIKMSTQVLEIALTRLGTLSEDEAPADPNRKKVDQCLKILQRECDREINLIGDILTLQQLDAEIQPFIPTTIQLQAWIPQVVETFEEQARTHQQQLQVEIPPELPPITTDLFMFNRVMGELLTNACKFTPDRERINVTAKQVLNSEKAAEAGQTPAIQIQVINTGVDVPADELEQIFQLFYRIPSPDPWKYSGTGLGLTLVKRLTANLGGQVWAESSPGQICFTVQLPLR